MINIEIHNYYVCHTPEVDAVVVLVVARLVVLGADCEPPTLCSGAGTGRAKQFILNAAFLHPRLILYTEKTNKLSISYIHPQVTSQRIEGIAYNLHEPPQHTRLLRRSYWDTQSLFSLISKSCELLALYEVKNKLTGLNHNNKIHMKLITGA